MDENVRKILQKFVGHYPSGINPDLDDAYRAIDGERFVQLLAEAISQNWQPVKLQDWVSKTASEFFCLSSRG